MTYDPEHNRLTKVVGSKVITYVGSLFESSVTGTSTEIQQYIMVNGKAIAIRKVVDSSVITDHYLHRDHLGSVDAITDESGALVERLSFDAFGARRLPATWTPGSITPLLDSLRIGFTGHEMDDETGLINMGARMYDPVLGRFLSPDPMVAYPYSSQGFNRYSYTDNNPLSRVDPTGYSWFSDLVEAILTIAAVVIIGVTAIEYIAAESFSFSFDWAGLIGGLGSGSLNIGGTVTGDPGGYQTPVGSPTQGSSGSGSTEQVANETAVNDDPSDPSELYDTSWGTDHYWVTSEFGWRDLNKDGIFAWSEYHWGIDERARLFDPIYNHEDGVIIYAGLYKTSRGTELGQVIVRHDDGSIGRYGHVLSHVNVGDRVFAGSIIGTSDGSGTSNGRGGIAPHLHYSYIPVTLNDPYPHMRRSEPANPLTTQLRFHTPGYNIR